MKDERIQNGTFIVPVGLSLGALRVFQSFKVSMKLKIYHQVLRIIQHLQRHLPQYLWHALMQNLFNAFTGHFPLNAGKFRDNGTILLNTNIILHKI